MSVKLTPLNELLLRFLMTLRICKTVAMFSLKTKCLETPEEIQKKEKKLQEQFRSSRKFRTTNARVKFRAPSINID